MGLSDNLSAPRFALTFAPYVPPLKPGMGTGGVTGGVTGGEGDQTRSEEGAARLLREQVLPGN